MKRKQDKKFNEDDKYLHKCKILLKRESKKIRGFYIRKLVQQIKQIQENQNNENEMKLQKQLKTLQEDHQILKKLDLQFIINQILYDTKLDTSHIQRTSSNAIEKRWINKIIAHKQLKAMEKAIIQHLEIKENELLKIQRKKERNAMARERKKDKLIGGRSIAAPNSLFLGSLSGTMETEEAQEIQHMNNYDSEEDIATFLNEPTAGPVKKKNRRGQNARRQKARALEEAAKRKELRKKGKFQPDPMYVNNKYGPSERPKKKARINNSKENERTKSKSQTLNHSDRSRHEDKIQVHTSAKPLQTKVDPVVAHHPSWIAKQAQKKKEENMMQAFQGKKITFDD